MSFAFFHSRMDNISEKQYNKEDYRKMEAFS